ncbi:MAG TPA: energy transducer TonB [Candidatus Krumholzibacteria bacterium]|nr:energy transducer TonB [Candidatus Krumholzibacteria bacterium]
MLLAAIASSSAYSEDDVDRESLTYPERCKADAREGYVLVSFDISPDGKPINPVVLEYCPSDIFVEATLKALRDWEYPATGEVQKNQQILMPFKLGKPAESEED